MTIPVKPHGMSFGAYAAGLIEKHASERGGDYDAIGRYRISGSNCQDFTLVGLGAGQQCGALMPNKADEIEDFVYEPVVKYLPRWLQIAIDKISTTGQRR